MKKKLIVLLALSCIVLQPNLQADFKEDVCMYYSVVRWIISEKINALFGKAAVIEEKYKPATRTFKFIKYRRKYDRLGRRMCQCK